MALDRAGLHDLLGLPSAQTPAPAVEMGEPEQKPGYTQRRFSLRGDHGDIPGRLLLPEGPGPHPGVLYCHAHGFAYEIGCEELTQGRPALQSAYGPALASAGIASLAIDLAPFGARQNEGPESALAKATFWRGETVMGAMLADLSAALEVLRGHEAIDATRIATLGFSMGATHAYWMAALHPDIAACVHLCAFANIAPLIETGNHDRHGLYLTIPGFLRHGDMADVAALIAPRPQLVGSGALDPLTPPQALDPAIRHLREAYAGTGALQVLLSPDTAHKETPEMRQAVMAFLQDALRP